MRVALVSFHRGGMAHYAAMMAHSILFDSEETELACFVCADFPAGTLPDGATLYRYPVPHSVRWGEWRNWVRGPGVVWRFWRDLRSWQPDVVHVNSGHLWYAPLVRKITRAFPLVFTMHDAKVHLGEKRPHERVKVEPLVRFADRIILHSEALRDDAVRYHGIERARTAVIPCGVLTVPDRSEESISERPNSLLLPGRIHAYKGYDVALEALTRVASVIPDVHLTIAGEGNFGPWQSLCERQKERVTVVNRFLAEDELARLLHECSVVILPYLEASQSGVALLAASFGKPLITSRVGSIPDVVEHGKVGLLVARGRPDALADAIIELLRDPERRSALGREARRITEARYGRAVIGRALHTLYQDVRRSSERRPGS